MRYIISFFATMFIVFVITIFGVSIIEAFQLQESGLAFGCLFGLIILTVFFVPRRFRRPAPPPGEGEHEG